MGTDGIASLSLPPNVATALLHDLQDVGRASDKTKLHDWVITDVELVVVRLIDVDVELVPVPILVAHIPWAPLLIGGVRAAVHHRGMESHKRCVVAVHILARSLHLVTLPTPTRRPSGINLLLPSGALAIRAWLALVRLLH